MFINDTISDYFSRISNAQMIGLAHTTINYTKFSYNILTSLEKEGFIKGFSINSNKKLIKVFFRYNKIDTTFIKKIKCISKPSNRIYFSTKNLTKLDFNTGTFLLSTSKGVISHTSALKKSVGGDVLCFLS